MGKKLSELLDVLHQLKHKQITDESLSIQSTLIDVEKLVQNLTYVSIDDITNNISKVIASLRDYSNEQQKLISNLESFFLDLEPQFLASSEALWNKNLKYIGFDKHKDWIDLWPPNRPNFDYFTSRIQSKIAWEQPFMIYGNNKSDIIIYGTGSDLLYSVEDFNEYFEIQKNKFHEEYRRKIRCYNINESNLFPKETIGTIVIYNKFPFMPYEKIDQCLAIFSAALAPGGTILFNYCNCTSVLGFKYFEDEKMTYMTPRLFKYIGDKYELKIDYQFSATDNNFHFIEMIKPGVTNWTKRHPSFGTIEPGPNRTILIDSLLEKK